MLILVSIITGVVSGVIASIIVWWYLYHYLSPNIDFSKVIAKSKSKDRGCGYYYQIMLSNNGARPAIDIVIETKLVLPNFPENGTDNLYPIKTGGPIMVLFPVKEGEKTKRRLFLELDDDKMKKMFSKTFFPDEVRVSAHEKKLSLEQLFSVSKDSYLIVSVRAINAISGSTKIFSTKYKTKDIYDGSFIDMPNEIKWDT